MGKITDENAEAEIISGLKEIDRSDLPPVHLWDPPFCGDIEMQIRSDGSWWHEGRPIRRLSMVKMFSSLLKKEADQYYLVTPVEKVGINVEMYPFFVVDMEVVGGTGIYFTTLTDDSVLLGEEGCRIFLDDNMPPQPASVSPSFPQFLFHLNGLFLFYLSCLQGSAPGPRTTFILQLV